MDVVVCVDELPSTKIMPLPFLLFAFVFFHSCPKVIFTRLPDCTNETEVENYLRSPQYLSLYSLNANFTKVTLNATQKALENQDLSLQLGQILPQNTSTYLRRRPPTFCNRPANAVFHLTLLSLDSINESDMVIKFIIVINIFLSI